MPLLDDADLRDAEEAAGCEELTDWEREFISEMEPGKHLSDKQFEAAQKILSKYRASEFKGYGGWIP